MEFKGTKGEWKVLKAEENDLFGGDDNYNQIEGGSGLYEEDSMQAGFSLTGFISKENALLISKAPELFEMIKKLIKTMPLGACLEEIQEAKQLLKEATEL